MPHKLIATDRPAAADLSVIGDGLSAFNEADVGPAARRPLAIFIEDGDRVTGGLYGYTAWGWLYVQWLFVPETLRGQGMAGRLLSTAEEEAGRRGCHGAWIDTFSERALRAYQRHGYESFGELSDFPPGRSRTFLKKRLE